MYETIVVGTDGSATAGMAVEHAAGLAGATGASLHVVHARRPAPVPADPWEPALAPLDAVTAEVDASILADAVARASACGVEVEAHAPLGAPAACLLAVADAVGADLLVVGSRGMHGARRVLGSVPNSVAHRAGCHVLVVHTC